MIIALLLVLTLFVVINFANCDIIFAPIKGLMFGALYNDEIFDEETEHTIQVLLFFLSINFIWSTFEE
jgi:hypothetical protein